MCNTKTLNDLKYVQKFSIHATKTTNIIVKIKILLPTVKVNENLLKTYRCGRIITPIDAKKQSGRRLVTIRRVKYAQSLSIYYTL